MAFVKLDCKILDSSLWTEKIQRDIFLTALLMAEPFELLKSEKQLKVRSLEETGFIVPAGWYGLIKAAGSGIIKRCGSDLEEGFQALEKLGEPDHESRSKDFEGRRLVRIDGGYIALNYQKYRDIDHTAKERQKRWRLRNMTKSNQTNSVNNSVITHLVTQAEAEVEAEEYKNTPYPLKGVEGALSVTKRRALERSRKSSYHYTPAGNAWCRAFKERFGFEYEWVKSDDLACSKLMDRKESFDSLIAWARDRGWNSKIDWLKDVSKSLTSFQKHLTRFMPDEKALFDPDRNPYEPESPEWHKWREDQKAKDLKKWGITE